MGRGHLRHLDSYESGLTRADCSYGRWLGCVASPGEQDYSSGMVATKGYASMPEAALVSVEYVPRAQEWFP